MYSRKKKSLSRLLKQQVKKVDNFGFFQNSPWFWSKTGNVFIFILQAKQAWKNVFRDILQRKKAFPHYKNSKLKQWKIWDFSKGVNPRFWLKIGNFSTLRFYHRRNRPRKCVLRIFQEEKKPFHTIKTASKNSRKFGIFP